MAVVIAGDPEFPALLDLDPSPPAVLFVRGDLGALEARRVGIVGTRNATSVGRETAAGLGHELAAAGVAVVSGLARGIDGAAHRGALAAGATAAVDARWPSSAMASTRRTRSITPSSGTTVCASGRADLGMAARHALRTHSASRCATGSWRRCARCWSSSRAASAAAA